MKSYSLTNEKYNRISTIQSCVVILGMFLIFVSNFKVAVVPSLSMYPTLREREQLICHYDKEYDYNDIAIFHPEENSNIVYVKRVVGRENDIIEVRNGTLYRNGTSVHENFTNEDYINYDMPAITVPEGHYFMMGDNRNNSEDSHILGTIPKDQCIAKVIVHLLPFWWANA